MTEETIPTIIIQIKTALAEKVLEGTAIADLSDTDLATLDSIGRLSLLVELENVFETELMGEELSPDYFESFEKLAGFVAKRKGL